MLEELCRILSKTIDEKYNLVRCILPDPDPETNIQPPISQLKITTNDKEICIIKVEDFYLRIKFSGCLETINIDMGDQEEDLIKIICEGIENWSHITSIPISGPFLEEKREYYRTRNPWYR